MENESVSEKDVEEDIDINMEEAVMQSPEKLSKNGHNHAQSNSGIDDDSDKEDALVCRDNDPAWDEERRHYQKIVCTFRKYSEYEMKKLLSTKEYIKTLPKEHQCMLVPYKRHLRDVRRCIEENQNMCILMILEESHLFENQDIVYPKKKMKQIPPEPTAFDFDKVQAVFKQIARDWSTDGKEERDSCYKPIIDEIESIFSDTKNEEGLSPVKILVPGAGLGRLAYELVCRGYNVQGNEFSLFMIFASNFLLNKCNEKNQYVCYPWVHQTTNVLNKADQIRPVRFPDVRPCELPPKSKFSMTAGDFLQVYGTPSHKENWDCVVACFFIDCASNIIAYLERIYYCLKMGGIFVNFGPLLYHYADMSNKHSIEPSYDVLREIIQKIGFVIEKEETNKLSHYAHNDKSMLSYTYNSVFLVCRKGPPHSDLQNGSPKKSTNPARDLNADIT